MPPADTIERTAQALYAVGDRIQWRAWGDTEWARPHEGTVATVRANSDPDSGGWAYDIVRAEGGTIDKFQTNVRRIPTQLAPGMRVRIDPEAGIYPRSGSREPGPDPYGYVMAAFRGAEGTLGRQYGSGCWEVRVGQGAQSIHPDFLTPVEEPAPQDSPEIRVGDTVRILRSLYTSTNSTGFLAGDEARVFVVGDGVRLSRGRIGAGPADHEDLPHNDSRGWLSFDINDVELVRRATDPEPAFDPLTLSAGDEVEVYVDGGSRAEPTSPEEAGGSWVRATVHRMDDPAGHSDDLCSNRNGCLPGSVRLQDGSVRDFYYTGVRRPQPAAAPAEPRAFDIGSLNAGDRVEVYSGLNGNSAQSSSAAERGVDGLSWKPGTVRQVDRGDIASGPDGMALYVEVDGGRTQWHFNGNVRAPQEQLADWERELLAEGAPRRPLDAPVPQPAAPPAASTDPLEAAKQAAIQAAIDEFKVTVRDRALKAATENGWCPQAEAALRAMDIDPQQRYAAEVTVTFKVSAKVAENYRRAAENPARFLKDNLMPELRVRTGLTEQDVSVSTVRINNISNEGRSNA